MDPKIIRKTEVADAFSLALYAGGLIVAPLSVFKVLCFVEPQKVMLLEHSEERTVKVYVAQHRPISKVVRFDMRNLYPMKEFRVKKSVSTGINVIKDYFVDKGF